jgi:3-methyl-2-oxobutanoate hydroxymethyltransferase
MSAHPSLQVPADAGALPVSLPMLAEKKRLGEPVVMVTAYDFPSARAAEAAGVDLVLVGDSGAMVVLGYPDTTAVTVDELLVLARAVRRGLRTPLLVGDLPFGSYEVSDEQAVQTAFRFVKEAGCDAVKLEGGGPVPAARARAIVQAGIPVMGHVGLTPQTATALGRLPRAGAVRGRRRADRPRGPRPPGGGLLLARLRGDPHRRGRRAHGAHGGARHRHRGGTATDGQVLVFHDLLGIREGRGARFVQRYADLQEEMDAGRRRVRRGRALGPLPPARARLLHRRRRARPLPRRARGGRGRARGRRRLAAAPSHAVRRLTTSGGRLRAGGVL